MLGKDLLIALDGKMMAMQRSCSLEIEQDTIEVCSPTDGAWRKFIPSTIGWSVSCDGLIYDPEHANDLINMLTSQKQVRLSFYDPQMKIVRSGYAVPTSLSEGASLGSLATCSVSFQGSGILEEVKEEAVTLTEEASIHYVNLGGMDDHRLVGVHDLNAYLRIESFVISRTSRVTLMCRVGKSGPCVIVSDKREEVYDKAGKKDNLWLFSHEKVHVSGARGQVSKRELLLPPGEYFVLHNSMLDNVSVLALSLPVE